MNPSTSFAPPAVKSGLSTDNPELMCDLLTGEFLLPHIAARHNIPLAALNVWVESEEVQSLLESCRRISAWRARYMAIDSIPRAIHGLLTTMEQNPGTEKARRAATSIINLAFKRDLSVPQDAIGRARSAERDQCSAPPRTERDSTPMPKASTEVAIPARRDSLGESPRQNSIGESVRPDGAGEHHNPKTTGDSQTRPPVATIAQPVGLSESPAQVSPLTSHASPDSPSPSASWISTARFTAADILCAVGAPRPIERPRSRAPT